MNRQDGGCLCGAVRFGVSAPPLRVTVCHCRFCQRATGGAYMVEPIFEADDFEMIEGRARTYDHVSAGSGKVVHVHFCAACGTKLWLSFERFEDVVGIYAGTFDNPCWFGLTPERSKHIFLDAARGDTVIPAGLPTFRAHATDNDGVAQEMTVFEVPTPARDTDRA